MFNTTLARLRCPSRRPKQALCLSALTLQADRKSGSGEVYDVLSGRLQCAKCKASYPILAGVAIVVPDVREFLLMHVKGIAALVPDAEIPREYLHEFKAAQAELETEHIEDDLEAERVISLYLMNHYLSAGSPRLKGEARSTSAWWQPTAGKGSPLIDQLVREYWDHGPLAEITRLVQKFKAPVEVLELGCGVGGLALKLGQQAKSYLGLDSSFACIALARHLVLGAPYRGQIQIPEDLLQGPVSRLIRIKPPAKSAARSRLSADLSLGHHDFVVGEFDADPVVRGQWDLTVALNMIDMLEDPARLPALQKELLKKGGVAVQSCPYIWHEKVAQKLRARLPRTLRDSAGAVEWLYTQAGFKIEAKLDHVPWLFFKHVRQLEIYSVHIFQARRE